MPQSHLKEIQGLVDHIESHLAEEINVLGLAKSLKISPWHFQRLFKSLVGDSLGSYIRGRRLSRAAQLLRDSNSSIIDIALEVGFNSHEAFSRSFKTQYEVTPKEFRNSKALFSLREKPKLSPDLIHFLSQRIDIAPEIRVFPEVRVKGFSQKIASPFMEPIHCTVIAEPWMKLLGEFAQHENLHDLKFFGITLSPSGGFTEELLDYIAGVETSDPLQTNNQTVEIILPAQRVAIFDISTNVQDDSLKQKVDSIYGYWLGNSGYERGPGHDFEFFRNMRNPMTGDFDASYVVPLKD